MCDLKNRGSRLLISIIRYRIMSTTEEAYSTINALLASRNICKPCDHSASCKETMVQFPPKITVSGGKPTGVTLITISGSNIEAKFVGDATKAGDVLCGGGGGTLCCCPCCIMANVTVYTDAKVVGTGSFLINLKECDSRQTASLYMGDTASCSLKGTIQFVATSQMCNGLHTVSIIDMIFFPAS